MLSVRFDEVKQASVDNVGGRRNADDAARKQQRIVTKTWLESAT